MGRRELHDERGPSELLATPGRDRAIVLDHDLLDDGQPEPGAVRLRREVRVEDSLAHSFGDPWAVVFDQDGRGVAASSRTHHDMATPLTGHRLWPGRTNRLDCVTDQVHQN